MFFRNLILRPFLCLILSIALLPVACKNDDDKESGLDTIASQEMAVDYLQHGQYKEAEAALKKAEKKSPGEVSNYVYLTLIYLGKKQWDDAADQLTAGLKNAPSNTLLMQLQARLYLAQQDTSQARQKLQEILDIDPKDIIVRYMLAGLEVSDPAAQKANLSRILDIDPSNMAVRLELSELLAREGNTDSTLFYLQSVKEMAPAFSLLVDTVYQRAVKQLRKNQPLESLDAIKKFHALMSVSAIYAQSMGALETINLPEINTEFNDSRFSQPPREKDAALSLDEISFAEISQRLRLQIPGLKENTREVLALADYDDSGNMYVFASFSTPGSPSAHYLFSRGFGEFADITSSAGLDLPREELAATFADYDNDGFQDLVISTTQGILLYHNTGDNKFSRVKKKTGLEASTDGNNLLVADFDQDGDLDLYVGCTGTNKFFRNNGDDTFTEQAAAMNLAVTGGTRDMDFGDWDSDGDLDIAVVTNEGSIRLLSNERHSRFTDITDSVQLGNPSYRGNAIAFGDYNNDGQPDLLLGGQPGGSSFLLSNTGAKGFVVDPASQTISGALNDLNISDVLFFDFDNDGREDLLIGGKATGNEGNLQLFHNEYTNGFSNVSRLLPNGLAPVQQMTIADLNLDGDDDMFMVGPMGMSVLRNDGGNLNHHMQVRLTGLTFGNGKNNRLGIGAQVEIKAGDLYQLKTIRRAITNFGIAARDSFDAVRIIWPNGTPQYIEDPSRRQKFIEQQKLKGSCPFLYAWDGKKYQFVKDMMWRSALGMPLAIHGKDTTYAFSDPSKEYLLIPGKDLQPINGKYSIKITEELWEAVYFDQAALIAVDHPDSTDVFADERFVAPPFPGKKVYSVSRKNYPLTAVDENGTNVLSRILHYDFQYVSNFGLDKFQGLAADHDLVLDLGDQAKEKQVQLFLRGWTFPADASINTSMAQGEKYRQSPPALQVRDKSGQWKTVIPNIGFPMGKDKMVVVDLSGKFLSPTDRHIRIRTNMQVYWDEIFFSTGQSRAPVTMHDLAMTSASLAYRGYSATYRKGGPFGPHWFDYYQTSQGQQWRDLTGNYTRYGDVLPLLKQADDEYIIANSGDEISLEFDATGLPALPKGWTRDFLIYSEGWVKDGDLNTAHGQTVEPLPFHAMPTYPYQGTVAYPRKQHQSYMQQYNTRQVNTERFKDALKSLAGKK